MRNNDFEYFTYEVDMPGVIDVYAWDRWTRGRLTGHPRKIFIGTYDSIEEALTEFPGAVEDHPAFEGL